MNAGRVDHRRLAEHDSGLIDDKDVPGHRIERAVDLRGCQWAAGRTDHVIEHVVAIGTHEVQGFL